ncbi:16S rRNA (cytosine(1402)-N(4))-methyltransferase [Lentilactobacillus curieae]|uniref:Ribosomal RNA small subunit methyltransferase H n=1 Tax=Lentilactobacillus curieae TaxID=1138822 RepID=A0A1S6QG51_9LACO|nr:16S rRNA (cytosine(1402)-N(4))-methyltransferase RsmH [Lentilactobacillus curieae]AQW20582.1 16S rRNA (cytosine(1402)-N(4))-methyltransferase [Lentilactobacillus curieae]
MAEFSHVTVLLNEAVNELNIDPAGTYIDATLGGGGHTSNILKHIESGHLYSFDQDETAIEYNQDKLADYISNNKLTLVHNNFRNLTTEMNQREIEKVNGVLYDLGVSSPQFDDGDRGFSYRYDARLDMRMNQEQDLDAWKVVNEWPYEQLVRIFFRYGEEKFSKQIARKIEEQREKEPIDTTGQLVEIIKDAIPAAARRHGGHPAKKVFQAIRVAVNDELSALEDSLESAFDLLNVGGRICVITFQSLEDKLVKSMFKEKSSLPDDLPSNLPIIPEGIKPKFKLITRKPILPSDDEQEANHRSHSAKLRVIERIKD